MHISKVSLVNYRNFENAFFLFNKGINTIIGENGSGKTNLFRAIRLLLEDSSYQFAYKLDSGDFNRNLKDWRGHWIIISLEFDEISNDESIQSLFVHGVGNIGNNTVKKATYNLFFRPNIEVRKKLSDLSLGDKKGLEDILNDITPLNISEKYETFITGKSTADFNDNLIYQELVGDFENVKFDLNFDTSKFGVKIPNQLSVAKEISFTFIKALRDVVSDFHNNKTNPLLALLKNQSGAIQTENFEPIAQKVKSLNEDIEAIKEVQLISKDIKSTIKDSVGATYSPSSLSIKSSLSDEADKLLQSLRLFIGEPEESYEGGIHELSLGGANLIFLTLKLLEYKYKSKQTFANFLIIEEPEAHLHTHIQKTLFEKNDYSDTNTQIIYSTHSTHISEVCNVSNINILAKKQNFAEVYQASTNLKPENIKELQRYLDAVRSNLLFAKGVILVEGDSEEILIPLLVKKVLGVRLDELGISLINIRSTGFENVAQLFHEDRIKRRCSILTDSDTKICDTTILASDSEAKKQYKTKVSNSHTKGLERKEKLDNLNKLNSWVKPFYSNYTFEVDFLEAGNVTSITKTVNKVYKDAVTIAKTNQELLSADVSIFGRRILTMANHEGKGWFAILLGAEINYETIIPKYIIDGIIFARESFPKEILIDMIEYRVKQISSDKPLTDFTAINSKIHEIKFGILEITSIIQELEVVIPSDQIIYFLKAL